MKSRFLGAVCVCILIKSGGAYSASFTGIDQVISGVSSDGNIVFNDASRWTASGGWRTWESYSGGVISGGVSAISHDGSIVTGNLNNSAYHWSASTGKTPIESPNNYVLSANDISAAGSLVVGRTRQSTSNDEAFLWTATSGTEGLGGLSANGVSADGQVVVGEVDFLVGGVGGTSGAAFWTKSDGWTSLNADLGSQANVASADGSVIFGTRKFGGGLSSDVGFRWTEASGAELLLEQSESIWSIPVDATADGNAAVGSYRGCSFCEETSRAFIWDKNNGFQFVMDVLSAQGIDLADWELTSATGISADGLIIVGNGINPDGIEEGWIANTVPLPPAVWLFGSGLLGLVGIARRKKAA